MQVLNDFLIKKDKGYYCKYGDFFIDPLYPVSRAVISHAHADHASPGHQQIYCTAGTAAFMHVRYPKQAKESYFLKTFAQEFEINTVKIILFPAGHILGSAQILMIYRGVRYLYTGDYKLQVDPTCEPIQIVEADVLITETTFANPDTQHPDPIEEIKKLNVESNILLGCYSLGKSQRITALINDYCPDKEVLIHYQMLPLHKIYDSLSPHKLTYQLYNRKQMKEGKQNKIYLVPPLTFNSYRRARNVLKAFASGWERLQAQNEISLYISDHVDWNDILNFIEQVKPKVIWTLHGDGSKLHAHFSNKFEIRDIESQTFLPSYC